MRVNVFSRSYKTSKGDKRFYLVVRERGKKDRSILLGKVSKTFAENERSRVLKEMSEGTYLDPSRTRILFSEFCDLYLKNFAVAGLAKSTLKKESEYLNIAKKAFEGIELDQIDQYQMDCFFANWTKIGTDEPVKGATKNTMRRILNKVFERAVAWKFLKPSQLVKIKKFKDDAVGSRALKDEEIVSFYDKATPRSRSLLTVAMYLGLRQIELSHLKFSDIDWQEKKIKIFQSKNGKEREVDLCPEVEKELKFLLDWWPNPQYFDGSGKKPYLPRTEEQKIYVFCKKDGSRCKKFKKALKNALNKVGADGVTPHGFRKTFCTFLAKSGVHPKLAQQIMGHSDIRTTMDIYTEVNGDKKKEAVNSLPNLSEIREMVEDQAVHF